MLAKKIEGENISLTSLLHINVFFWISNDVIFLLRVEGSSTIT